MSDLENGFIQGFEEAKRRIAKAMEKVETSWTEQPEPFAYEPPKSFDRRPGDVLAECIGIASDIKVPKVKEVD